MKKNRKLSIKDIKKVFYPDLSSGGLYPDGFIDKLTNDYKSLLMPKDKDFMNLCTASIGKYFEHLNSAMNQLPEAMSTSWNIGNQIADELVDKARGITRDSYLLPESFKATLPELRPLLTATKSTFDVKYPSFLPLNHFWNEYKLTRNNDYYNFFRSGLDFLDLDPMTYRVLQQNPNDFSFWYPKLLKYIKAQDFFTVPETKYITVPLPILQLTRINQDWIGPVDYHIVNKFCSEIFDLDPSKKYFIRTGVFADKEDFSNCVVTGKDVEKVGEKLLGFTASFSAKARPDDYKIISYGGGTTTWVVRDYIEDYESHPTIFNGRPLRNEFRVFVDFDRPFYNRVIGIAPLVESFYAEGADKVLDEEKKNLDEYFEKNKELIQSRVEFLFTSEVENPGFRGQWSVDIMQSWCDFYIIDMAMAQYSALNNWIPETARRNTEIDWIPAKLIEDY